MFAGLLAAAVAALIAGWMVYWRHFLIPHATRREPVPKVSVVIPARDEEQNLPRLLDSIAAQTLSPYEVIVADDGSADQTALIAKRYGVKVVTVRKETDWRGKTAGCFQGAQAASGDVLVFMDADTWFADAEALSAIVSAYGKQGAAGLLSIQPYHEIRHLYENLSSVFNIMTLVGMSALSILGNRVEEAGVFGPFLLCTKDDYFKTGGHRFAKEALIEGFALREAFRKKQLPVRLYGGRGAIHFQMYPSGIRELADGWTKHIATGSKGTHPLVITGISLWIAGAFLIPAFLLLALWGRSLPWMLVGFGSWLAYVLQFHLFARRTGNFSFGAALVYPVLFLFFVAIYARSWLATNVFRSVQWKGQKIDL